MFMYIIPFLEGALYKVSIIFCFELAVLRNEPMMTVMACGPLGSHFRKNLLSLHHSRSFSALKFASQRSTRTAPSSSEHPPSAPQVSTTSGLTHSTTTSSNASSKRANKTEKKAKKASASDTTEAQLKQIESMMNMANTSNLFPTMDMWGAKILTLGMFTYSVQAPLRLNLSRRGHTTGGSPAHTFLRPGYVLARNTVQLLQLVKEHVQVRVK